MGLGLAALGLGLGWLGLRVTPTPGLSAVETPLSLPLGGAETLDVRLTGDRTALTVAGIAWPGREALTGRALHRERNPLSLQTRREEGTLAAELRLDVRPLEEGVIGLGTPALQHRLEVQLARSLPVTLNTDTAVGETRLDLHALRVRALSVRGGFGDVVATLPERQSGPLTFVTLGGGVSLRAGAGWRSPALRVNTESGDVRLSLGAARSEALNIGTRSGDVRGELPRADHQSVTTGTGGVELTLPDGAAGTFDVRSEGGTVRLSLPPGVRTRVRFTDRTALSLPPGLIRQSNAAATDARALQAPDLDLFLDAPTAALTRRAPPTPEGDPRP
nr:DUF4097 domain-containing protein [Deinococcus budaensis]